MADLTVPKGDYGYDINFTVKDADAVAYNLTGYTITLKVWSKGVAGLLLSGACTIVVAASGTCKYSVAAGNFSVAGTYDAELELTKSGIVESTVAFTIAVGESN
jgi:hypothetical protein